MNASILKIRLFGDPCLRKKSHLVKNVGPSERILIQSMIAAMHEAKGVGLAAPQIGINQRIFVADIQDGNGPIAFINPKIIKRAGSEILEEGCLSIPGVTIEVKRAKNILVRYRDENNKLVEKSFNDLLARVIQHENDHLHGKMIVDYAGPAKKKEIQGILEALEEESK